MFMRTPLSFWESGTWVHVRQRLLWPAPGESLAPTLRGFPGSPPHVLPQVAAGGRSTPCASAGTLVPGFLSTSPRVPLSFDHFALYLFTINHTEHRVFPVNHRTWAPWHSLPSQFFPPPSTCHHGPCSIFYLFILPVVFPARQAPSASVSEVSQHHPTQTHKISRGSMVCAE